MTAGDDPVASRRRRARRVASSTSTWVETDDPDAMIARSLALLVGRSRAGGVRGRDHRHGPPTRRTPAHGRTTPASSRSPQPPPVIPNKPSPMGDEVGRVGGTYLDQIRAHLGRAFGFVAARRRREGTRRAGVGAADRGRHRGRLPSRARPPRRGHRRRRSWDGHDADTRRGRVRDRLSKLGVDAIVWQRVLRSAAGVPGSSGLFAKGPPTPALSLDEVRRRARARAASRTSRRSDATVTAAPRPDHVRARRRCPLHGRRPQAQAQPRPEALANIATRPRRHAPRRLLRRRVVEAVVVPPVTAAPASSPPATSSRKAVSRWPTSIRSIVSKRRRAR